MAKSMLVLWSQSLLLIALLVPANRADAGTLVTVNFSGTASGSSTGNFSGAFTYDMSEPKASLHTFRFVGTTFTHSLVYTTDLTGTKTGTNITCESFTITTFNGNFVLVGTVPKSPATTVTITIPTGVAMSATYLPGCSVFPASPVGSTFKLTGGYTYTGNLTRITSCTYSLPAPVPPAPPCSYVYTCTYPAPCPVYACPPRQACLLTRLFARRSRHSPCW
jgi:hypothetical protein